LRVAARQNEPISPHFIESFKYLFSTGSTTIERSIDMEINWHETMKGINILQDTLRYSFIRASYPMTWPEISDYAVRQLCSDPRHKYDDYASFLVPCFRKILEAGYQDLIDLALHLTTQDSVIEISDLCDIPLKDVTGVLYYLTYWLLPRNFYLRDLVRKGDRQTGEYCAVLRKCGLPNSLDLLEAARSRDSRAALSNETGIPPESLDEIVHRADLSRVGCGPNMVNNYYNSGFDTVEKLAQSDLDDLVDKVGRYLATLGKVPKYGMDLPAHHPQVRLAPKVVETYSSNA
jgi:hypothetical protein